MSTRIFTSDAPRGPVSATDLEAFFQRACKPREKWRLGAEFEKVAIYRADGRQLPYDAPDGIRTILSELATRFGWQSFREGDNIVALLRDGATVTIEPGGQVELSTAPAVRIAEVEAQLEKHRDELWSVVDRSRIAWLALGLTPFQKVEDIVQVPKQRYRIMAEYLPPRGDHALYMMRGTASVQTSLDFSDEVDAGRKLFVALSLSPIVNTLFGNSPVYNGRLTGVVAYRGRIWERMDPARAGVLADVVGTEDFTFQQWIDYLLDAPMMFYCLNDAFTPANGRSFRDFMAHGLDGYFPTLEDWEMHLTEVFPEVRIKKFIEVRGADCVRPALSLVVPAVWKAIFYDDQSLEAALALARQIPASERLALFTTAYQHGLEARFHGRPFTEWCREILEIARAGLKRLSTAGGYEDESGYLEPAFEVLERRRSPGMQLIDAWPSLGGDPASVADFLAY